MRTMILTIVLGTALCVSAQELTVTSKVTGRGTEPETTTSYISPDHVRMSQTNSDVIFDLKTGTMTVIERAKKQYYVTTEKDMDEMAARVQEYMKQMPPEMRERMQSRTTATVRKTGETRTIAGYKCENWEIDMGPMMKMQECVTTDLKLPPTAWERFRKLTDRMRSMSGGAMGASARLIDELAKVKGFPLATTHDMSMMGRTSVTTSEVTDIKYGSIPSSAWEVPAGYTRIENPMTESMHRMPPR